MLWLRGRTTSGTLIALAGRAERIGLDGASSKFGVRLVPLGVVTSRTGIESTIHAASSLVYGVARRPLPQIRRRTRWNTLSVGS
jgi:hypothetical protein